MARVRAICRADGCLLLLESAPQGVGELARQFKIAAQFRLSPQDTHEVKLRPAKAMSGTTIQVAITNWPDRGDMIAQIETVGAPQRSKNVSRLCGGRRTAMVAIVKSTRRYHVSAQTNTFRLVREDQS